MGDDKQSETRTRITNAEIADALAKVGTLLDIVGGNPFKVRAYADAARTIGGHGRSMRAMLADGEDLTELPGIGADIADYIEEMVATGELTRLRELTDDVPIGLIDVMDLPGVGPKTTRKLWHELGIESIDDLEAAARQGKVEEVEGLGAKTQDRMLDAIEQSRGEDRFLLGDADEYVEPLVEHMRAAPGLESLDVAGSYRRRKETVGDIDLLAVSDDAEGVMEHFVEFDRVEEVREHGDTRGTVVLRSGLQVDLRILPQRSHGAALAYFTGSKEHTVELRRRAVERDLRISEYGVFRVDEEAEGENDEDPYAGEMIGGEQEKDVYAAVDLPWIPPELREHRGEIEAAEKGELPELIELDDIRGDLQVHTTWSDGRDSLDDMVAACRDRGYEYVAITDHGKALPMTEGLDADRLRQQWEEIDEVAERHDDIRILRSMEVDVLKDGSLDLEDDLLEELDIVLVAIHSHFDLPADEQTERIIRALEHPAVHILAHPTGRLIQKREPMDLDLDEILDCAVDNGVAVELNAQPERLDLPDYHVIDARQRGLRVVISTDAHRIEGLDVMRYGVDQARRAWLGPSDVLNTLSVDELLATLAGS